MLNKHQQKAVAKELAQMDQILAEAFRSIHPSMLKHGFAEIQLPDRYFAANIAALTQMDRFVRMGMRNDVGHAQLLWHFVDGHASYHYPAVIPHDVLPQADDPHKVFILLRVWTPDKWAEVQARQCCAA